MRIAIEKDQQTKKTVVVFFIEGRGERRMEFNTTREAASYAAAALAEAAKPEA